MSPEEPQKNTADTGLARFDTALQECAASIASATVPIVALQGDKFVHDRSGVLYRIGDRHLILTASHAGRDGEHDMRAILHSDALHCVFPNSDGVLPVPLAAPAGVLGTEVDGRDIAIIDLPKEAAAQIKQHRRFIQHDEVLPADDNRACFYLLIGYPEAWSLRKNAQAFVHSDPLVFLLSRYTGEPGSESWHDPNVHLFFGFERDAVDLQDRKRVELPELFGISGCGIWRFTAQSDVGIKTASSNRLSLVAIQNRWHQRLNYVVATRVDWVLNRILDDYPELERPMALKYIKNVPSNRIMVPKKGSMLFLPK